MKRLLLKKEKGKSYCKSIEILSEYRELMSILSKTAMKILSALSEEASYPNELAKKLKIHEQKVYYHIRRMQKAGIIEIVKEEKIHGALCKYFAPVADAFGVEITKKTEGEKKEEYKKTKEFFNEFIRKGFFDGSIVVSSPSPHGPYLTSSKKDAQYAAQLAMFLGNFCELPKKFVVRTDTEIKTEKAEKKNMILVGGPITNIISHKLNEKLKIKFVWENNWRISSASGKRYSDERIAFIAKIKNPFDETKSIILLAGLKSEGTKACVIALTNFSEKVLKEYKKNREFFRIIKALDKDGDGKTDDIEIIE